jgi:PAS domain S-box-containing protein
MRILIADDDLTSRTLLAAHAMIPTPNLPNAAPPLAACAGGSPPASVPASTPVTPTSMASSCPPRIVVVNDDPAVLSLFQGLLSHEGFEPVPFPGAAPALDWLVAQERLPDLIITDLHMPGIDGWRFCRLLRSPEYAAFNRVPILIVSATFAGEDVTQVCAATGANAFLPSPVSGALFLEQVRALLAGQTKPNPARVLVIEDDEALTCLVRDGLAAHGYQVSIAHDGQSGRKLFAERPYEVVITDYLLPDTTGEVLLQEFAAVLPRPVVVVITGNPNPGLATRWLNLGAAAYVRKPFDCGYLAALCANLLRERSLLRVEEILEERTRALRENAKFLEQSQRVAHLGFYTFDIPADSWTSSAITDEIFGLQDPSFVRNLEGWLQLVHPDEREALRQFVQTEVLAQHRPIDKECRILRHNDHEERWVHVLGELLLDDQDRPLKLVGTIQDITARKRLEDQFRQAQKMEAIGQLAGGVAHDFNNILTAFLMHLGLLRLDPRMPAELGQSLTDLEHHAKRASGLTRQLLLFSRRQVMQMKPVNLNEILDQMLKMLRRLLGEQISIELPCHNSRLWIEADAGMIEQIILNLCVNARDAMPGGGRLTLSADSLEVSPEHVLANPEARTGRFVRLSVADTGCGMDEATLRHIFEPFFTTKEVGKGTGLGLATVFGIVKQHRGWLEVNSAPGQGSTFSVFVPACAKLEEAPAETPSPKTAPGGKETILLVEDEWGVRNATALLLRHKGYRVLEATNGPDALRQWTDTRGDIDLLFSDMVMPQRMTGLELARRLRSEKPCLKVVLTSGYSAGLVLKGATLPKDFRFLPKPSHAELVASIVRDCLDQQPHPQPDTAQG